MSIPAAWRPIYVFFAGIAAPWQAAQSLGVGLYKSTVLPLIIWTFLWQAPHRTF